MLDPTEAKFCDTLLSFTSLLLAAAEDEEDLEVLGLVLTQRATLLRSLSRRFGPWGSYDVEKSKDFLDITFNSRGKSTKSWLRCVAYSTSLSFLLTSWQRMSQESFWHVHDLICHDPVFRSTGSKPQRPVKFQLAAFLVHVGSEGGVKTASAVSIAEGTVWCYVRHVSKALRQI